MQKQAAVLDSLRLQLRQLEDYHCCDHTYTLHLLVVQLNVMCRKSTKVRNLFTARTLVVKLQYTLLIFHKSILAIFYLLSTLETMFTLLASL